MRTTLCVLEFVIPDEQLESAIVELRRPFGEDVELMLQALRTIESSGLAGFDRVAEFFRDPTEPTHSRCWIAGVLLKLGKKHNPQLATEVFVEALKDQEPSIRRWALWCLGRIGDPGTVPQIAECLNDYTEDEKSWDDDSTVRSAAIGALRKMGSAEAKAALDDAGIGADT